MSRAFEFRPRLAAVLVCAWCAHGAAARGKIGSDWAISPEDQRIVGWASGSSGLVRGPQSIFDTSNGYATFGSPANALGRADVTITNQQQNTFSVVSLGDGGSITLTFDAPIRNGLGPDLAVFENSFSDTYLELALVEVSSDGIHFTPFPSISLTPTAGLVEDFDRDDFSLLDPANLYNLAGKYRGGLGTPFDLAELAGIAGLDINHIIAVRIEDVVGSINPLYARYDSKGHIIKDPFPTVFPSGGFDLDAVAVLYTVPEPTATSLLFAAAVVLLQRRRR